ncbi:MAG: crosslink repair DNA glycosylase YcaQ family protein [Gammaproteobacteria bacterium]
MELENFHPATAAWFRRTFAAPTEAQVQAWPAIREGRNTLIAAPTGSGKTLAAFLAAIDGLVRAGLAQDLKDECRVLYVSPLKALSNDIQKNLQAPLEGIRTELLNRGLPDVEIRAWVRSGDTPQSERERMRRVPPHILVTTPESLYILLTSESGRRMLTTVRTVIVDEIHALAGNKRGAHLALSLERLNALCGSTPVRIGLSATQKPTDEVARFLTGTTGDCNIIDTGYTRERRIQLEMPKSPLAAVMSNEVWTEIYDRLAELILSHKTTLIFANTRRLAERAARHLAERIGEEHVTAHHGSLARAHRLDAEQRLKRGELKALVATASLELGIDIGDVDLVCQLGSPRSIGTFLQRVGRSGHAVGALPEGHLFPLSRDELVECTALLDCVRRGELDRIRFPVAPLDVLAQQIVAEVAAREWDETELFERFRHAYPYHELTREAFTEVLRMLAEGFSTRRGRRSAYLHRDAVNGKLRGRRGARLVAITNGGAIPDQFDYDVVLSPEGLRVGTLNEDFAFESIPGDIFQLGNTSYRILKLEQGKVYVADAKGQPPNIPFWFGEAPGRSAELSAAVSRLRETAGQKLCAGEDLKMWLENAIGLDAVAATQLQDYLTTAHAALGVLPTQDTVVFERFFDETGDQHLVIHAPFGSRLNRAWGLALRKRFCRKFNFELQAAALEDTIVLSLGATHSFPLEEAARYLHSGSAREVLEQAVLAAPMFGTRWRWVVTTALAVQRNRNGKRTPPAFQRADAEDLVAVVFPDQLACAENLAGAREIPEHPLVQQTLNDCLHEVMDVNGFINVLRRLESGDLKVVTRDLSAPSPLAQEILGARPYAFLDDAPAEERRTLAVQARGVMSLEEAGELAQLDPHAIARVRAEIWPGPRDADELHDALTVLGFLTESEGLRGPLESGALDFGWQHFFEELVIARRATRIKADPGITLWVAAERLEELLAALPDAELNPVIEPVREAGSVISREDALRELLRSRLEGLGPVTATELARPLGLAPAEIDALLLSLEAQGGVMRGRFTPDAIEMEWCDRRLLARIHRYTLKRLSSEIEPVAPADYLRFLLDWHGLNERSEGRAALAAALEQLEGYSAPAAAWEEDILPARVADYAPYFLDQLCAGGLVAWTRLTPLRSVSDDERKAGPVRGTPIALVYRENLPHWRALVTAPDATQFNLSHAARTILAALQQRGALFFGDIVESCGLLRTQVETALGELTARGLVTADSFAGLRALITPQNRRPPVGSRYRMRRGYAPGVDEAGRWSSVPSATVEQEHVLDAEATLHIARALLSRYGVVFRQVLTRESGLPPWRDLLYSYRRLEARGEIRGGRFVQGFSGEQFALPEAVGALREWRKRPKTGALVSLSAADPLNLVGVILPGQRVPMQGGNRVLYRDGVAVAVQVAEEIRFLEQVTAESEWELRNRLLRKQFSPVSGVIQ